MNSVLGENLESLHQKRVVVEWLQYSKRIFIVRKADLSEFCFVDFRR